MPHIRLRDRDAIITEEELIFRVYGYSHPPNAHVCDPEYAPETIFKSPNPKAFRMGAEQIYYKFFADEGLQFVQEKYPRYTVFYAPMQSRLVGVSHAHIVETRRPNDVLQRLMKKEAGDGLLKALQKVLKLVKNESGLSERDFGVFGSILHDFYHPRFSDLDFIIYGKEKLRRLRETLGELYGQDHPLQNEFEKEGVLEGKPWSFVNLSSKEYLWHQRRKMIYGLFSDRESGRVIKTEFEPVKYWSEIRNAYNTDVRIVRKDWIKAIVRVTEDEEAAFIPSIYQVEPLEILEGAKVETIQRILSYMEEFRMQAMRDEVVYVEGNLEQVVTPKTSFHQITLTRCPRYYEQVLKVLKARSTQNHII
ncbi:MAG: nucleotidyltransferase domain-containing protein [Candidatus Bathyarchaeia archaeon]